MKKRYFAIMMTLIMTLGLIGCSSNTKETSAPLIVETEHKIETVADSEYVDDAPEGQMHSYLTGELIDEKIGTKRPYAIMINNIQAGLPQSGVASADIIYEAQVEGGITRLMAVFQDVDNIEKIGTIRSARHYYIDFANDNDAIYVHYGQSKYAKERFEKENIVTIHGISAYETQVFYRSTDRQAPHNVYTTGDMLAKGLEITGLSRDYPSGYTPRLLFNAENTDISNGTEAEKVNIPFDSKPYFTYNTEDGLYYRFQYGEPHIDRETDKQLAFKNIIVQYVKETSISKEDHQDLAVNGEGMGLYITNGQAMDITWKRSTSTDRTKYYDADGNEIKLNPGKSFFEVLSNDKKVTFGDEVIAETTETESASEKE